MLVPGDGTVTAGSLLGIAGGGGGTVDPETDGRNFASVFFFCETHGLLPANRGFQDNLFHVLFHSPTARTMTYTRAVGGK